MTIWFMKEEEKFGVVEFGSVNFDLGRARMSKHEMIRMVRE